MAATNFYEANASLFGKERLEVADLELMYRLEMTGEEFYYRLTSANTLTAVNKLLRRWEDIYNTYRPHQSLGQITPLAFHQQCA